MAENSLDLLYMKDNNYYLDIEGENYFCTLVSPIIITQKRQIISLGSFSEYVPMIQEISPVTITIKSLKENSNLDKWVKEMMLYMTDINQFKNKNDYTKNLILSKNIRRKILLEKIKIAIQPIKTLTITFCVDYIEYQNLGFKLYGTFPQSTEYSYNYNFVD